MPPRSGLVYIKKRMRDGKPCTARMMYLKIL